METTPILHQFTGLQLQPLANRYQKDHSADQDPLDEQGLKKEVEEGMRSFQTIHEILEEAGGLLDDLVKDQGYGDNTVLPEASNSVESSDTESGYTSSRPSSLGDHTDNVSEDGLPPTPGSTPGCSSDEESDEEPHHSIYAYSDRSIILPKPATAWGPIKKLPRKPNCLGPAPASTSAPSHNLPANIAALNASKQWLPIPGDILSPAASSTGTDTGTKVEAGSKRKKTGNRGRGHEKRRKLERSKHRADSGKTRERRLAKSLQDRTIYIANKKYSLIQHGLVSKSGWGGTEPLQWSKEALNQAWDDKSIHDVLKHFSLGPCDDVSQPLALLDRDDRVFFYRTSRPGFFMEEGVGFALVKACQELIGTMCNGVRPPTLPSGTRGLHEPVIIGYHREYSKTPTRTSFHNAHFERAEKFARLSEVRRVCIWISKQIQRVFPGVWLRFKDCVKWHQKFNKIECHFDIFWNFCFNAMYEGQSRVHCRPHSDHKNVVGVCVVLVYELPNSRFDYKRRTWLVIWDAGIIVEMQPWTAAIYPSSLFYHFNVDLHDIEFVTTEGERPTRFNSTPIVPGDDSGRGSMVFFNQASMFQQAELGGLTVQEAKNEGLDPTADYDLEVELGFPSSSNA